MGEPKHKSVLVATDGSEHSQYALQWALDTGLIGQDRSQGHGDKVFLLHAKEPAVKFIGPEQILVPVMIPEMEKLQEQQIASLMNEGKRMCEERNVAVQTLVEWGDAREVICDTVDKLKVDFLVIGSHGYGAIKRMVLGSVSDYCAHHAHCPVVIVKKPHQA
eukprot:c28061_g4_i1 orf=295-780(+)